jgi:hypothetical protein
MDKTNIYMLTLGLILILVLIFGAIFGSVLLMESAIGIGILMIFSAIYIQYKNL